MWRRLFTDRRSLLLWYRLSVFIVWILPWGEAAGNVGGSYGDLSGDAGAFGLSAFCKDRRSGDLGSHSDWMGLADLTEFFCMRYGKKAENT